MTTVHRADHIDAQILLAMMDAPRVTVVALADRTGLSRNTVQARVNRLEERGALQSVERRIDPATLGYPLRAFIRTDVIQRKLASVADELVSIPEVLEVHGLSGAADLLVHVVARDADDLYRVAGRVTGVARWAGEAFACRTSTFAHWHQPTARVSCN